MAKVEAFDEFLFNRYNNWLDKLADISVRQSAAYGLWNFSFNSLYHSTQVDSVILEIDSS